jgi:hypothetical protein
MVGRLLGAAGSVLLIAVALVTPILATPAAASAVPITLVQQSSNASIGSTSIQLTLPSSIQAGDALVASYNNTHDGLTIVSISGGGLSWQLVNQENDTAWGTADSEIWYGRNSAGGPSTITVNLSGTTNSTFYALNVSEWSGLGGVDAAPAGSFDHSGTSTVAVAPATTPTTSGDLFIGVAGSTGPAEEVGAGPPGGGFTAFPIVPGIFHSAYGYLVAQDAATHQFTQPLTQAGAWSATAAAFSPSSTSAPPPPTTGVLLPSDGATVSGTTWLDAGASSPVGLASVTFEVSGGSISDKVVSSSVATLYGYIGAWDTTDVPNGTYTLYSVATDADGNVGTSLPFTFRVNNQPPATAVLVPSNGATLSGSTNLDASASNATSVEFLLFGGPYGYSAPVVCKATPTYYGWLCSWNTTTVPNGSYALGSEASGPSGSAFSKISITVKN